ncbi:MAG: protease modulator HflK [Rhizobiaceae bacterium]
MTSSIGRFKTTIRRILHSIGTESIEVAGLSLIAILAIRSGWNLTQPEAASGTLASIGGGIALVIAFGLLVLERHFAGMTAAEWPEASALGQLTRVPIVMFLVSALCLFASRTGGTWPRRLAVIAGLLPLIIALELIVRAVIGIFQPMRQYREPRPVATSLTADLLRWPPPRLASMLQDELRIHTGIDLRRVWAVSFMRRASLPVLACIVIFGWVLTGIREVPMNGRGVYERFGRPDAVLQPGLHAGLPWPFGRIVPVENGQVHELAAVTPVDATEDTPAPAEGPAPESANRLWDVTHVMEKSQIIASQASEGQNFQIVDLDIRFFYRIGLSDEAALAATYNTADLPGLIRSVAGRVLVHEFASRTLDGVLGEKRTALAHEIAGPLQTELDRVRSGARIVAVVVEAVHPPAGAADAYHGVQAAEIESRALVARERGDAAERTNEAETKATIARDRATASAHESVANADAVTIRADGERKAYDSAGRTFLLERYYEELDKGLSQSNALILDHRIAGVDAPTVDLRDFAAPVDAPSSMQHSKAGKNGNTEEQP